ncbi:hypothetical protein ABZ897_38975 [Nonomuraea sp. NPDC046802]|uniref:hypothetical protein n=1 Tax=Nonomuraea sp. NPDC046802 TaxID=3154919 RepID=UPI0033F55C0B
MTDATGQVTFHRLPVGLDTQAAGSPAIGNFLDGVVFQTSPCLLMTGNAASRTTAKAHRP